jgi:hypothetical protein
MPVFRATIRYYYLAKDSDDALTHAMEITNDDYFREPEETEEYFDRLNPGGPVSTVIEVCEDDEQDQYDDNKESPEDWYKRLSSLTCSCCGNDSDPFDWIHAACIHIVCPNCVTTERDRIVCKQCADLTAVSGGTMLREFREQHPDAEQTRDIFHRFVAGRYMSFSEDFIDGIVDAMVKQVAFEKET